MSRAGRRAHCCWTPLSLLSICPISIKSVNHVLAAQSRAEGALLLDPTVDEAAREEAGLTLALMPACSEVRLGGCSGTGCLAYAT